MERRGGEEIRVEEGNFCFFLSFCFFVFFCLFCLFVFLKKTCGVFGEKDQLGLTPFPLVKKEIEKKIKFERNERKRRENKEIKKKKEKRKKEKKKKRKKEKKKKNK